MQFYYYEIKPCYDCFDLHTALLHQIGHALSLGHSTGQVNAEGKMVSAALKELLTSNVSALSPSDPANYNALTSANELAAVTGVPVTELSVTPLNPAVTCTVPNLTAVLGVAADAGSATMSYYGMSAGSNPGPASRRCLTPDDTNGLNFLYPSCGPNTLSVPACTYRTDGQYVFLRLFEDFLKMMILPFAVLVGVKLLAYLLLCIEDGVATYQVRRAAKEVIKEAKESENHRWSLSRSLSRGSISGAFTSAKSLVRRNSARFSGADGRRSSYRRSRPDSPHEAVAQEDSGAGMRSVDAGVGGGGSSTDSLVTRDADDTAGQGSETPQPQASEVEVYAARGNGVMPGVVVPPPARWNEDVETPQSPQGETAPQTPARWNEDVETPQTPQGETAPQTPDLRRDREGSPAPTTPGGRPITPVLTITRDDSIGADKKIGSSDETQT